MSPRKLCSHCSTISSWLADQRSMLTPEGRGWHVWSGEALMRLPDPEASCAVLIGTSAYKELEQLPAIARNLESLQALFTSPDLWGLPARNCRLIPDPKSAAEVLDT